MDEQTVNQQQTTNPLGTTSGVTAAPRTDLPSGVYDYSEQIASMYDAQQAAKEQALASAYELNKTTLDRERAKISPLYQTQANDLSTQYERNRRNNNFQADLNGLNTGTASQMGLAQNNAYMKGFGQLRAGEAAALTAADQQAADLEMSYKNSIAQALADNDYQKATALLSEYQRRDAAATAMEQYNRQQQEANAKLLAAYGDFSGYAELFGAETANKMRDFFLQANPDYAWANGLMDATTYYRLTGKLPSGYSVSSSGGSGGRGGGNSTAPLGDRDLADTLLEIVQQAWRDNGGNQLNAGDDYYAAIGALNLTPEQQAIAGAVWSNYTRTQNGAQTKTMDEYSQIQGKPNSASSALFGER